MKNNSRRSFLKKSAIAMAGAGLYSTMPNRLYGSTSASDRVNIGVIGVGFGVTNMRYMLEGDPGVHCIALCDVDQIRMEEQAAYLKQRFPANAGNIKLYSDFRKLL